MKSYSEIRNICRPLEALGGVQRRFALLLDGLQAVIEGEDYDFAYRLIEEAAIIEPLIEELDDSAELAAGLAALWELRHEAEDMAEHVSSRDYFETRQDLNSWLNANK